MSVSGKQQPDVEVSYFLRHFQVIYLLNIIYSELF